MDDQNKRSIFHFSRQPFLKVSMLISCACLLILCAILASASIKGANPAHAATGSDFTQGAKTSSSNQALFWFQPQGWTAGYVILHYNQSGIQQQNPTMAYNNGTAQWEFTAGGMSAGQVITYFFTYQKGGLQYDTSNYTWTVGSSGGVTPTPTAGGGVTPTPTTGGPTPTGSNGTFPFILKNNTHGTWADSQVYVLILGQGTPGQWSYLTSNGTLTHINHLDANAPNHLTKNGVNYANMSFSLSQASSVLIPTHMDGSRMYISLGSPMYIPIAPDDSGWGGPNLGNPNDPNADVYFDWYEFAYGYKTTPFGGNTTQVDMFGFPMTARLQQTAIGYDQTIGITLSRQQVYTQYAATVSEPFKPLATTYRILAPHSSASFSPGGSQANYMQGYIDQTWSYYTTHPFTLNRGGVTFSGGVVNGQLQFTRNGAGPYFLNKPTSVDVLACSGALASGGMSTQQLELGAEVCAAFNRGVAQNTANWYNPSTYYTNSIENAYAGFWHQVGIDHRAYGFPYDDVNDQSSVKILPNANAPTSLTITIGW